MANTAVASYTTGDRCILLLKLIDFENIVRRELLSAYVHSVHVSHVPVYPEVPLLAYVTFLRLARDT